MQKGNGQFGTSSNADGKLLETMPRDAPDEVDVGQPLVPKMASTPMDRSQTTEQEPRLKSVVIAISLASLGSFV
jgi:hypothetical protein